MSQELVAVESGRLPHPDARDPSDVRRRAVQLQAEPPAAPAAPPRDGHPGRYSIDVAKRHDDVVVKLAAEALTCGEDEILELELQLADFQPAALIGAQ